MASSSTAPKLSEMIELSAHGLGVPILFPVNGDGVGLVSAHYLSIRFGFLEHFLLIEREVYDPVTSELSMTMLQNSTSD